MYCRYHWPHGVLIYTIDAGFSDSQRAVIASAMAHIEENTCIRWTLGTALNIARG